jgi:glycerol-3-phosphate O-acyltransferase
LAPDGREAEIARLGEMLMRQIARTVPALPVSLVAWTMLDSAEEGLTEFELKGRVFELMQRLEAEGAYIHIPRRDREYAIDVGVRMLLLRRLILEADDQYRANPAERTLLAYYANAIAPLAGSHGIEKAKTAQAAAEIAPAALAAAPSV